MIVVFDTETTSLLGAEAGGVENQPRIIEFAALKFDYKGKPISQLFLQMNPRIPITDEVTKITGYTDNKVRDFKPFVAHWQNIADFWDDAGYCVGHNVMFDKRVLFWELTRLGKEMNFPWIRNDFCTADTCNKIFGHRKNLTDLHLHFFGEAFVGAHGALPDATATAKVFFRMMKDGIANLKGG